MMAQETILLLLLALVFTDYQNPPGWGRPLWAERWLRGSENSATLPHQFTALQAPVLNIFMPRPWKSKECSHPQNFSFLTCRGKVTRWLHKWLWDRLQTAGQAENRKGILLKWHWGLSRDFLLSRQFVVLQHRACKWASSQKILKGFLFSTLSSTYCFMSVLTWFYCSASEELGSYFVLFPHSRMLPDSTLVSSVNL